MSNRRFSLFAALCVFIAFIALNLTASVWLRSWRLDLTENQLYSLSAGTQDTLDALTEPVELTLYFSRDAASANPQLQAYGARVREMLQTFAARAHGRVRFIEIDVEPFSEEEDRAVEAGLAPLTLYEGADPFYFGLTGANAIDDRKTIPTFSPEREPFLEYEITRLIYELERPDPTRIGLITSLPLDPNQADSPFPGGAQPMFAGELGRLMQVTTLAPDFTEIPADIDVLVIIHPQMLTDVQDFAIDQFIMRKGRAFIAVDPASLSAQASAQQQQFSPFGPPPMAPPSSNMARLMSAWGVSLSGDVVLDLDGSLPVQTQGPQGQPMQAPQPLFFRVDPDRLDRDDLMTAWLARGITFGLSGALNVSEREGVIATPLARTTARTTHIPAERALMQPSPFDLINEWPPTPGQVETVALHVSGVLASAFPDGPPEGAPPAADGSAPLTQSAGQAQVVIVADADFIDDAFYVAPQSGTFADNGAFALNAIEVLGGSDALVSLRSRAPGLRPMDTVERMERDAQRMIQQRRDQLQSELAETESNLARLQSAGQGSGFFAGDLGAELTEEERVELDRFRNRVTQVRSELRSTERDLRVEIDRLQAIVVFVNVWAAPVLVACAGLFLFWRRQRRTRGKSA